MNVQYVIEARACGNLVTPPAWQRPAWMDRLTTYRVTVSNRFNPDDSVTVAASDAESALRAARETLGLSPDTLVLDGNVIHSANASLSASLSVIN